MNNEDLFFVLGCRKISLKDSIDFSILRHKKKSKKVLQKKHGISLIMWSCPKQIYKVYDCMILWKIYVYLIYGKAAKDYS